jgi:hypothetical protein
MTAGAGGSSGVSFLGSDGIAPAELRRRALLSLQPYDITVIQDTVRDAQRSERTLRSSRNRPEPFMRASF